MEHRSSLQRVEPRQIFKLSGARGVTIRVRLGMAWLTEPDVADDHFLTGEQIYCIRSRGVVLIEPADMSAVEFEIIRSPYAGLAGLACRARKSTASAGGGYVKLIETTTGDRPAIRRVLGIFPREREPLPIVQLDKRSLR